MTKSEGEIVQIIGPVVDVYFEDNLPEIFGALKINDLVLEVQEHLGNGVVRTIAMGATEGLSRGDLVTNLESPITTPVGNQTLGRILNVLGEPVDGGKALEAKEKWSIHKKAPKFSEQNPEVSILETGIFP